MPTTGELEQLLARLRSIGSDVADVEVKRAATSLPQRLWETVSAFANTAGGGLLILGVDEANDFAVTGVRDAGRMEADLASLCDRMVPPVRAMIGTHHVEGQPVVTCEIPEVATEDKPCHYGPSGLAHGSYVRVADGDRRLTEYEIYMLRAQRRQPTDDLEPVPGATLTDLDPGLVRAFVDRLRTGRPRAFADMADHDVLARTNAVGGDDQSTPTIAGLLSLGTFPQQFFPQLNVTFVVYPGIEPGQPGPAGERFLDNQAIDGPIPEMVARSMEAVRRNMKRRAVVTGVGRQDVWEYPDTALREAIVNAIVHRDLSVHARGTPVQIEMFPDRLAIQNPGGLFGPLTIADLIAGGSLSSSRNSALLRILEDTPIPGETSTVCENRGSGIPAMIHSLRDAGLGLPVFTDRLTHFRVDFPNHTLLNQEVVAWLEALGQDDLTNSQVMGLARMYSGEVLTNASYRAPTSLDSRVAGTELKDLVDRGLVEQVGTRGAATYELAEATAASDAPPSTQSSESRRAQIRRELAKGPRSRQELQEVMGLQPAAVLRYLRQMKDAGEVEQVGAARSPKTKWRLIATPPSLFDSQ